MSLTRLPGESTSARQQNGSGAGDATGPAVVKSTAPAGARVACGKRQLAAILDGVLLRSRNRVYDRIAQQGGIDGQPEGHVMRG